MVVRTQGASRGPIPMSRAKRNSLHMETPSKKRRKVVPSMVTVKQPVAPQTIYTVPGTPLVFGVGDTGQLGLGPDLTERSRPSRFNAAGWGALLLDEKTAETFFTQVCAGGMHTVCLTANGRVITCGCNDEGALGRKVSSDSDINDQRASDTSLHVDINEIALKDAEDAVVDETHPGYVPLPLSTKITMVSAGDSHTAALDSNGQVWLWGTFRGPNGPIGLTQPGEISMTPRRLFERVTEGGNNCQSTPATSNTALLTPDARIIKIASGQDHLVLLTDDGRLYTMGCGEQGQLGRIAERFARTGGRSGMNLLLQPSECRVRGAVRFSDAWAGGFATFARCQSTGAIYACGLNNYGQLGLLGSSNSSRVHASAQNGGADLDGEDVEMSESTVDAAKVITDQNEADKSEAALIARQGPLIQFMLTRAFGFIPERDWRQFAVSMHHTLALDKGGTVYAVGRPDYGRLGLGFAIATSGLSVPTPTPITSFPSDRVCSWIACGEACSFAVDTQGTAYSWGMGSNRQLGHGEEDEDCYEPGIILGKQLQNRRVSMVDAGGQHTVLLAHPNTPDESKPSFGELTITDDSSHNGPDQGHNDPKPLPLPPSLKSNTDSKPIILDAAQSALSSALESADPVVSPMDLGTKLDELSSLTSGLCTEPLLVPPMGAVASQTRRVRRLSPSSISGSVTTTILGTIGPGGESTTCSTAGATINSSVHSSLVSDSSSVGSCASNTSTSSQLNSAKSTDGGGSSRCSSFDTYSIQSSLPVIPLPEDHSSVGAAQSRVLDPFNASVIVAPSSRDICQVGGGISSTLGVPAGSARIRSAGMSICSTSSEPGIPTDTTSLGSMTASPGDLANGEHSNN
ncbi:unnamed protein product [Calicophoron daubneyi]|uniref:RCC1-like domain-containing protein n=1 Tax=Calicophoron daubneyi TaxID=300641 RepID=A0AAV2TPE7_CALDB